MRMIPTAIGEQEAKKYGARFAEVSALTGEKVEEVGGSGHYGGVSPYMGIHGWSSSC